MPPAAVRSAPRRAARLRERVRRRSKPSPGAPPGAREPKARDGNRRLTSPKSLSETVCGLVHAQEARMSLTRLRTLLLLSTVPALVATTLAAPAYGAPSGPGGASGPNWRVDKVPGGYEVTVELE